MLPVEKKRLHMVVAVGRITCGAFLHGQPPQAQQRPRGLINTLHTSATKL